MRGREGLGICRVESREIVAVAQPDGGIDNILEPASASAARRLSSTARVSAPIPPGTTLPSGPTGTLPETKTKSPASTAGESGTFAVPEQIFEMRALLS